MLNGFMFVNEGTEILKSDISKILKDIYVILIDILFDLGNYLFVLTKCENDKIEINDVIENIRVFYDQLSENGIIQGIGNRKKKE